LGKEVVDSKCSSSNTGGGNDGQHHNDRPPRFQKMDFPRYDGKSDPLIFVNRCESYFHQQRIMEEEKVWMASYNLEDGAQLWYIQVQADEQGTPTWPRFKELLHLRFGPPIRSAPLFELADCRRTGSVEEYQDRFQALLPRAGTLTDAQKVQLFTGGLLPPLSMDVRIHNPQTLGAAMSLARQLELREQYMTAPAAARPPARGLLPAPQPRAALPPPPANQRGILPLPAPPPRLALPAPLPPAAPAAPLQGRQVRRLSQAEMDERRRQGLCFNCDERFSKGHNRVCQRLFLLDLEFDDDEAPDEEPVADEPNISVHAIAGIRVNETMQVRLNLGGVSLLALLDSGSTHNFISEEAALRAALPLTPGGTVRVTVANGDHVPCPGVYRSTKFSINKEVFTADFYALALAGYDVVLGTQWLASLGPILWDFAALTLSFWRGDHQVCWRGQSGQPSLSLRSCTGDDLLQALLDAFAAVFSEPQGMPPPRSCDHGITLVPGSAPIKVRPYRYPAAHKDELERQCASMMTQGIIRRSSSAFSSPVLLVRKADGSWRFCVDYRALNAITIKDAYPIPVVDELLDELRGARFFTKLDLRSGYHQVRMRAEDISKTAFRTHDGLYEFLVMPFGLCNAPATFQALMNDILRPFLRRFVLVFFDDILIYSSSWTDHLRHVRTVLDILLQHRLFVKRSKCSFATDSVAYLGHVISADGVSMDPEKVRAVADWPAPRSARAVRGFLGLAGYYRKFVKDFGTIAAPLTALLRKDGFSWSAEADEAFQALKTAVTSAPVLVLPDFTQPFIVECDASTYGFGAVLIQGRHPVAFFSRPVAPRHRSLAAYERELIGLVTAIRHWRPYLWGRHFLVRTDHYSLKFLLDQRLATIPQHHWVGKLLGFDFTVEYKAGSTNIVADALSRRDTEEPEIHAISGPTFDFVGRLRQAQTSDPALVALSDEIKAEQLAGEWALLDGMVTFKGRLYIPPASPLLHEIIAAVHDNGHEGVQRTLHRLRRDFHAPNIRREVQDYIRACATCQRFKSDHLHPAGLLLPLPVPTAVWTDIGLDFIEALPKVGGKSVILTVVDRFSKYCHFIPLAHPYTAESVAQAFFSEIVRLHGVPQSMVSDRDPVFTSKFWQELMRLSGAKLHMTSAFHPQSDGQTEAANKIITMYLRCFTGDRPRQWLRWLPWAEYVYNTAFQSALRDTPFRVVYGRDPPSIRSYEPGETRVAAVAKTMAERDEFLADVRGRLEQAQAVYKKYYDNNHREVLFEVGDWVWLRLRHRAAASLHVPSSGKLKPRFYGPYRIIAVINEVAYKLELPPHARLHDVFHVGLLKKFVGTPPSAPPALPNVHHGAAVPEPESVLRSRLARGVRQLLVRWKGETAASATWEDVDSFIDRYPSFQLEDELLLEGGRDVMWGHQYRRQVRHQEQKSG
jgi:hypothetical protein